MKIEKDIQVSKNHPSLAGHFPGHPIVPGVVLIDEIIGVIQSARQELVLKKIRHIKFLKPLSAGDVCHMNIEIQSHDNVSFTCSTDKHVIAKGKLIFYDKGHVS